jgi:hypothetical protein
MPSECVTAENRKEKQKSNSEGQDQGSHPPAADSAILVFDL